MLFGGELCSCGEANGTIFWIFEVSRLTEFIKELEKVKFWNNLMVTVLFSFFMGKLIFSFLALKPFCFGWMPHASLSICFWLQQFLETFTLNYSQTPEILPTPPRAYYPCACSCARYLCKCFHNLTGSKLLHAKYNRVLFRRGIKHRLLAAVTKWLRPPPHFWS